MSFVVRVGFCLLEHTLIRVNITTLIDEYVPNLRQVIETFHTFMSNSINPFFFTPPLCACIVIANQCILQIISRTEPNYSKNKF